MKVDWFVLIQKKKKVDWFVVVLAFDASYNVQTLSSVDIHVVKIYFDFYNFQL